MKQELIEDWITQKIASDPQIAINYKQAVLATLHTQLTELQLRLEATTKEKTKEEIEQKIPYLQIQIKEIEGKSAEQVLTERFVSTYKTTVDGYEKLIEEDETNPPTEEDYFICGAFIDTEYNIRNRVELKHALKSYSRKDVKKIKEIYKERAVLRDIYVEDGKDRFQKRLASQKNMVEFYYNDLNELDAVKPNNTLDFLLKEAETDNKSALRSLAEVRVEEVFRRLGTPVTKYEAEDIKEVIDCSNLEAVNNAIKQLIEHPTYSMRALSQAHGKRSKHDRLLDFFSHGLFVSAGVIIGGVSALIFGWKGAYLSGQILGGTLFGASLVTIATWALANIKNESTMDKSQLVINCIEDFKQEIENQNALIAKSNAGI